MARSKDFIHSKSANFYTELEFWTYGIRKSSGHVKQIDRKSCFNIIKTSIKFVVEIYFLNYRNITKQFIP